MTLRVGRESERSREALEFEDELQKTRWSCGIKTFLACK